MRSIQHSTTNDIPISHTTSRPTISQNVSACHTTEVCLMLSTTDTSPRFQKEEIQLGFCTDAVTSICPRPPPFVDPWTSSLRLIAVPEAATKARNEKYGCKDNKKDTDGMVWEDVSSSSVTWDAACIMCLTLLETGCSNPSRDVNK
jgi:hypothetical protein